MAEQSKARAARAGRGKSVDGSKAAQADDFSGLATLAALRTEQASSPARSDVARYVAEMSAELATLAGSADLDLLAYFLNMAQVEAESVARRSGYEERARF